LSHPHDEHERRIDMAGRLTYVSYQEALRKTRHAFSKLRLETEKVPLGVALGRTSAQAILADHDMPKTHVSAMDGYAFPSRMTTRASTLSPVRFTITRPPSGDRADPLKELSGSESCYIQTGAPVPRGADAVLRVEEAVVDGSELVVSKRVERWKNVMKQGGDIRIGRVIARKGGRLGPATLALVMALGRRDVEVFRIPRVGILSVGSELRTVDGPDDGRQVNNYAHLISGFLREFGAEPVLLGVSGDAPGAIHDSVSSQLNGLDMLITTGRSSVGLGDTVPAAIASLPKSEIIFHGVKLLPLRPTGVASVGGKPVCILPGHSVSAALAFFLSCVPILNIMMGAPMTGWPHTIKATSTKHVPNDRPFTALFLVQLAESNGGFSATPLSWGSNSLSNLSEANGFLTIPPRSAIKKGQGIVVTLLGDSELSRTLQS
jgi:molybdopterin molybdotransferase